MLSRCVPNLSTFRSSINGDTSFHEAAVLHGPSDWRARRIWLPTAAAIIGLVLCTAAWLGAYSRENRFAGLELDGKFANHALILQSGIGDGFDKVSAVQALFESSGEVSRQVFSAFGRSILSNQIALRDVSWSPRVTRDERAAFELAARNDGFPDYQIKSVLPDGHMIPAPEADVYFPIFYTTTEGSRSSVYGIDLHDGNVRQQTLDRARDTGEVATSRS